MLLHANSIIANIKNPELSQIVLTLSFEYKVVFISTYMHIAIITIE